MRLLKRAFIIVIFFTLPQLNLEADWQWKEIYKVELGEKIVKIQCQDSCDCIMLVTVNEAKCRLYESDDGGFTWNIFHDEVPGFYEHFSIVTNLAWPTENHLYLTLP